MTEGETISMIKRPMHLSLKACLLVAMAFSQGCASPKTTFAFKEDLQGKPRILAPGSYDQRLEVTLKEKGSYRFLAKLRLSRKGLTWTAKSPNGKNPLFSIQEAKKEGTAQLTLYRAQWEPIRPHIEAIYKALRPVLFVGIDNEDLPIALKDYDSNGVPRLLTINNQAYQVDIKNDSYSLE